MLDIAPSGLVTRVTLTPTLVGGVRATFVGDVLSITKPVVIETPAATDTIPFARLTHLQQATLGL